MDKNKLLELIHIDINGPLKYAIYGSKYFITFAMTLLTMGMLTSLRKKIRNT